MYCSIFFYNIWLLVFYRAQSDALDLSEPVVTGIWVLCGIQTCDLWCREIYILYLEPKSSKAFKNLLAKTSAACSDSRAEPALSSGLDQRLPEHVSYYIAIYNKIYNNILLHSTSWKDAVL